LVPLDYGWPYLQRTPRGEPTLPDALGILDHGSNRSAGNKSDNDKDAYRRSKVERRTSGNEIAVASHCRCTTGRCVPCWNSLVQLRSPTLPLIIYGQNDSIKSKLVTLFIFIESFIEQFRRWFFAASKARFVQRCNDICKALPTRMPYGHLHSGRSSTDSRSLFIDLHVQKTNVMFNENAHATHP
jgi:hypothetical protein